MIYPPHFHTPQTANTRSDRRGPTLGLCLAAVLVLFPGPAMTPTAHAAEASPPTTRTPKPQAGEQAERTTLRLTGVSGRELTGLTIDASPSIVLTRCRDITIQRCDLRSIELRDCQDIKIVNSWLHGSDLPAVSIDGGSSILVQGNRVEQVASALYAHQASGVRFIGNNVHDVVGPMPRGQMVQLDKVTGKGNRVTHNLAVNHRGQSRPEDVISLYQSQGEPEDPILIAHNTILGDPELGSEGKSDSGSGIMLGDGGGEHILCEHNTLISPGQVGIGVAGGDHITVRRNRVVGRRSDVSNVGIYTWNQSDKPGGHITVSDNYSDWTNAEGRANPWWAGRGFEQVTEQDNTFLRQPDDPRLRELLNTIDTESRVPPLPYGEVEEWPWEDQDSK